MSWRDIAITLAGGFLVALITVIVDSSSLPRVLLVGLVASVLLALWLSPTAALAVRLGRDGHIRAAVLAIGRQSPLGGTFRPNQPYSPNAQLWVVVPAAKTPRPFIPMRHWRQVTQGAYYVAPTVFSLYPVNRLHLDGTVIRITDIVLRPIHRLPLPSLKDSVLVIDGAPKAGGRGAEAYLRVACSAGLAVPIALLTSLRQAGTTVPDPEIAAGDQYEIALQVTPSLPGLYTYEVELRCTDGRTAWSQRMPGSIRLARLTPEDYPRFGRFVRIYVDTELVWDIDELNHEQEVLTQSHIDIAKHPSYNPTLPDASAFIVTGAVHAVALTRRRSNGAR